jgi:hypothetical protein
MSDLPVQPLFLPLIHELARYAASHKEAPLFHRVGTAVDFRDRMASGVADPITAVVSPSGRREGMAAGKLAIELQDVGFYEGVRRSGARTVIAVNLDASESDLTSLDQGELVAAVRPAGGLPDATLAVTPAEEGARQSWWRVALLSLALLLVMETVLANAGARGVPP